MPVLTPTRWRRSNLAALKTATKQDLVTYINSEAAKVQSMQATVDIDTSVGGAKKGQVTEYEQIRGFVLARKPEMLRMIGLYPIVRNRAFDMVSDGHNFKLWIPTKNRFVVGRNDVSVAQPRPAARKPSPADHLSRRCCCTRSPRTKPPSWRMAPKPSPTKKAIRSNSRTM